MIVVKLMGGLGNQLFQYAAARALALRKHTTVFPDQSFLNMDPGGAWTKREFELDVFKIPPVAAPDFTVRLLQKMNSNYYLRRISSTAAWVFPYENFIEKGMEFQPALFDCPANTYLDGYFQTEKYYAGFEDVIRRDFEFVAPPDARNGEMLKEITASKNSISIHVRRGDYVNLASANTFHGVCGLDYYERAIQHAVQNTEGTPKFFVFSDEPEWARNNLNLPGEATFIDFNKGKESYNDLRLMRHCKHHIIANSSFSWWGAWLNPDPKKLVIAPERWFASNEKNYVDLIPPAWLKL